MKLRPSNRSPKPIKFPRFIKPLLPCNLQVQRCPVPQDQATQRILIMRLGSYGDIVMGTPLLTALREAYPKAHLTWLVEHSQREAIDANPFLDEILVWNGGYWRRMLRLGLVLPWLIQGLRLRSLLRHRNFDIFITFHAEQWPLVTRAVAAPKSVGIFGVFPQFDDPKRHYARLYSKSYQEEDLPPHRTDIHLLALKALNLPPPSSKQMTMGYTSEDAEVASAFLREHFSTASSPSAEPPLVVIAPKTTWESRCWPEDRYVELGDRLMSEHHCHLVLIGSPKEQAAVDRIASQMRVRPATAPGTLRFRQMAALLGKADLVISGDTGPMHVAAAVRTPYLALFGPTPVRGRAPLEGRGLSLVHPVPCGPCDLDVCRNPGENYMLCMNLLTVEEVLAAAKSLLQPSVNRP